MCTAIRFNERYFGRTFDFERSFGESLVVTPREKMKILEARNRYAMMGVGVIFEDTPLYFDGVNEWGLAMAALNSRFLPSIPRGIILEHLFPREVLSPRSSDFAGASQRQGKCFRRSPLPMSRSFRAAEHRLSIG